MWHVGWCVVWYEGSKKVLMVELGWGKFFVGCFLEFFVSGFGVEGCFWGVSGRAQVARRLLVGCSQVA